VELYWQYNLSFFYQIINNTYLLILVNLYYLAEFGTQHKCLIYTILYYHAYVSFFYK